MHNMCIEHEHVQDYLAKKLCVQQDVLTQPSSEKTILRLPYGTVWWPWRAEYPYAPGKAAGSILHTPFCIRHSAAQRFTVSVHATSRAVQERRVFVAHSRAQLQL